MALLVRNRFRFDPQTRLAILMNVPVVVFMLLVTVVINKTRILDPFTAAGRASFGTTFLLYLAIAIFPSSLKTAFTVSTEAGASWLILCAPADRGLLLRAVRRVTELFFVAPYLLLMAAIFGVLTGTLLHTIQHFAVVAVLVFLETEVLLYLMPELPFSKTASMGASGAQLIMQFVPAAVVLLILFVIVTFVYATGYLFWPVLGVLVVCAALLRALGPRHAARRLSEQEE